MTIQARIVLQDCKFAIRKHTLELQGEEFRASWITILTLLRAVGHVLDKVDAKSSSAMEQAIKEWWESINLTKPEPAIFWQFIDDERNRMIKLYEHGIKRELVIDGPVHQGQLTTISIDHANSRGGRTTSNNGKVESEIQEGLFSGRYEREVAHEAYEYLSSILDNIDARAGEILKINKSVTINNDN